MTVGGMVEEGVMETASGAFIDLLNPAAELIDPADITWHLAQLCRYTGASSRPYSVAEHVVLVHDLLRWQGADDDLLRAALLHDAAEAYLGDVSSPLKWTLRYVEHDAGYADTPLARFRGAYGQITRNLDRAIGERFEIDPDLFDDPAVKEADLWALYIEARALLPSRGKTWRWTTKLPEDGDLPAEVAWTGGLAAGQARSVLRQRMRARGLV